MNKFIPVIIAVIVAGGAAFYGGMQYAESRSPIGRGMGTFPNLLPEEREARMREFGGGAFVRRGSGGMRGAEIAAGEVIAKDETSVTVKLRDSRAAASPDAGSETGGSRIVFFTAETPITKSVSGSAADVAIGAQVFVNGTRNQDGSITADSIQIRPAASDPATSQ